MLPEKLQRARVELLDAESHGFDLRAALPATVRKQPPRLRTDALSLIRLGYHDHADVGDACPAASAAENQRAPIISKPAAGIVLVNPAHDAHHGASRRGFGFLQIAQRLSVRRGRQVIHAPRSAGTAR